MSKSRTLRRAIERTDHLLSLAVAAKRPLNSKGTMAICMAGNTGSGIRRRAAEIVADRAAKFVPSVKVVKLVEHLAMYYWDRDQTVPAYTQEIVEMTTFDVKTERRSVETQIARYLGGRS